jgi:hypothetical protein
LALAALVVALTVIKPVAMGAHGAPVEEEADEDVAEPEGAAYSQVG